MKICEKTRGSLDLTDGPAGELNRAKSFGKTLVNAQTPRGQSLYLLHVQKSSSNLPQALGVVS